MIFFLFFPFIVFKNKMASKRSKRSKRRSGRKSSRRTKRRSPRKSRSKRRSKKRSPRKGSKRGSSLDDRCYTVAGSNFKALAIRGKDARDKLVKSLRSKGKTGINSYRLRCRPHYKRTPTRYNP
jgi:hypothetical protein